MRCRTFRTRSAVAGVLATAALLIATGSASAATQRYASATGSGDCSAASPCTITQAVTGAVPGNEVIVEPGDYQLTATLQAAGITIHGVAGQPRPRLLFTGAAQQGLQLAYGSTLRYVEVDQAPGNNWPALDAENSLVDQVIAKASGIYWTASINNSTIRNSIVL
jgi:hypothetical protein